MDRTKRQAKAARENLKKNSKTLSSFEEDAMGLEELLLQSRKKADATKAARARVADLHRQLEELQNEEDLVPISNQDPEPEVAQPAPAPASQCRQTWFSLKVMCQKVSLQFLYWNYLRNLILPSVKS